MAAGSWMDDGRVRVRPDHPLIRVNMTGAELGSRVQVALSMENGQAHPEISRAYIIGQAVKARLQEVVKRSQIGA